MSRGTGSAAASLHEPVPSSEPDISEQVSSQYTLSQAIFDRRAEFTQPTTVRIKVGTWNVASTKGTEEDLASWFVGGKGISQSLSGLKVQDSHESNGLNTSEATQKEGVSEQEARWAKKESTVPMHDYGDVPGHSDIGIYALGLQEVVDLNSATEALRPYTDPSTAKKWRLKLESALPKAYTLVAEQQLVGLLLLIYASPDLSDHVRSVSTTSIGTGLMGYMGNKGAVTCRIVLGETTRLVFVNSHLSSGANKADLERRNWDATQIMNRTRFDPVIDSLGYTSDQSERIGDEDLIFWFGDMNYRLEGIPAEDVRRLLMLHTRHQYGPNENQRTVINHQIDEATGSAKYKQSGEHAVNRQVRKPGSISDVVSNNAGATFSSNTINGLEDAMNPSDDPTSLQTTLESLLSHDELRRQQKARKIFHDGWVEGPITFLPTYKYDLGSVGVFDSTEKKRSPSWCDRILFRTRSHRLAYEAQIREEQRSKQKDAELRAEGVDKAADDEAMLFEYDPDTDGEGVAETDETDNALGLPPSSTITKEGYEDELVLDYYISHQRVLSSDHKPLEAIFTVKFDAINSELKSKVHQDVAKNLDRAENENRPNVAVVVDGNSDNADAKSGTVEFGDVRYMETKTRTITIANTGRVLAYFGLVARDLEANGRLQQTPVWLMAHTDTPSLSSEDQKKLKAENGDSWNQDVPQAYLLRPGESCSIHLTVDIGITELARSFNEGTAMQDVLILRVKDGRDHFVPVHGSWKQSSFGHAIDKLVRITEGGVRRLQHQHPSSKSSSESLKSLNERNPVMWSVPREVFRLTEVIEILVERILAESSMLGSNLDDVPRWVAIPGWPFVSESMISDPVERRVWKVEINEALDTDQPFDTSLPNDILPMHKLEAFSETLVLFLENLSDGIITESLWSHLMEEFFTKERSRARIPMEDQRATILEILSRSSAHSASFVIIVSMLARLCLEVSNQWNDLPQSTRSSLESATPPKSPRFISAFPKPFVRRKTLDEDSAIARRLLLQKALAAKFADVLIRVPRNAYVKGKYPHQEEKCELIEIFLQSSTA